MLVTPREDGTIAIGPASMPTFAALDLATRILEACGDVPEVAQGRVRCREYLDRTFARSTVIAVRDMGSGAVGRFPSVLEGGRLLVRLSDTVSATLLDEGERWRGFAVQWRFDPLFGCVGELAVPMRRVSAAAPKQRRIA